MFTRILVFSHWTCGYINVNFWGYVKGVNLDILDLWLVGIRALGRPNVIVLDSLALEPS